MARSFTYALLGAIALTTVGCHHEPEFDRLEIGSVNAPDLGGDLDPNGGEVFEGTLVAASLQAFDTDDEPMELQLVAADPSTLDVRRVSDRPNWWAFLGTHEGTAGVDLVANGQTVRRLRFAVLPQK